jgi:murein DD-endopeptidase MepM/ murein hydrolase activator NlpD
VLLALPLSGPLRVQNSPADRVPSHGTEAFGSSHAVDLVPVDARGRSAPGTGALRWAEPPERFVGWGRPVRSPVDGVVVTVHDGEPDHEARRSQPALTAYLLGTARRARRGPAGLAGNHVVVAVGPRGPFVTVAHLRCGSVRVRPGDSVAVGLEIGACGNSGNSTEPHVHLQASDSTDWAVARGVPLAFRRPDGSAWLPRSGEVVPG